MRKAQNSNTRIRLVDSALYTFNSYPSFIKPIINIIHWSSKDKSFEPTSFPPRLISLIKSTGQRPYITISKKGVSQFGIRIGSMTGIKVTLRGFYVNRYSVLYFCSFIPYVYQLH